MRTWVTLQVDKACGLCGRCVPAGEVVQTVKIDGLKRELLRCAACATADQPAGERNVGKEG